MRLTPTQLIRYYRIKSRVLRPFRAIKWATQRLRRGWSDDDLIDFDGFLTGQLADQLSRFADRLNSHPSQRYGTFEEYEADMRKQVKALRRYSNMGNELTAVTKPLNSAERIAEYSRLSIEITKDGQDALRWVADNLPSLWD